MAGGLRRCWSEGALVLVESDGAGTARDRLGLKKSFDLKADEPGWFVVPVAWVGRGPRVEEMLDISDGSENILLSEETCSEFAREFVSDDGKGKLRGGVGKV